MSTSESTGVKPAEPTWYQRNQKEISYVVILTGIALTMISLAAIAVSAAIPLGPDTPQWVQAIHLDDYFEMGNLLTSNILGGAIGIYGLIFGICGILCGSAMLYGALKKAQKLPPKKVEHVSPKEAEKNTKHQMRKNIAIVIGFAIAMFGVGMILAGSLYVDNVLSRVKDLYDHATNEGWDHQDFWQAVNTDWIQPVSWRLPLMITAGVITTIAGAGIMASACGYSLCRGCVKDKLKKPHEDNQVAPAGTDDL